MSVRKLMTALLAVTAVIAIEANSAAEALTWKDHACWCRTHHRKGHGLACAAFGVANMISSRRRVTEMAIIAMKAGRPEGAMNLMMACQCQNPGAQASFAANNAELLSWLDRGGPC